MQLLRCDPGSGNTASVTVGANQADSVMLNGHKLIIPAGAVTRETVFSLHELKTPLLKVRLQVNGRERFTFPQGRHATLVINYGQRCTNRDQIAQGSVGVYRLRSDDREDVAPLEASPRPTTHYNRRYEARASLSHLSGYGVGWLTSQPD